jgi:Mg2+ and Co2+ transporter CorA
MKSVQARVIEMDEQQGIDFIQINVDNSQDVSNGPNESTCLLQHHKRQTSIQSGLRSMLPLPGMQIRAHLIETNGDISLSTVEDALSGAKAGRRHYWIDIDADERDADELREWLLGLNLPHFLLDVLAEPPEMWASQVVPLQRAALAVIRILPEQLDSDKMSHLAALHLRNLLLTFTSCPRSDTGGLYAPALAQMKEQERLPAATSSGALLAWLRFHIERTSRSTRSLRYTVLACDEAMDRDVTSVKLDEIIAAKDQLLRLLSVAEEQTECLESLAAVEADTEMLDFSPVRGSLSMLLATAGATERMALRLEKHVAELRQRHEGHEHEKMNRRLAVLTVFSVIFLPLTLFTGIWGMNFENMPELKAPDAYPMALLLMVTVAVVMMCYFQRTGWFE